MTFAAEVDAHRKIIPVTPDFPEDRLLILHERLVDLTTTFQESFGLSPTLQVKEFGPVEMRDDIEAL